MELTRCEPHGGGILAGEAAWESEDCEHALCIPHGSIHVCSCEYSPELYVDGSDHCHRSDGSVVLGVLYLLSIVVLAVCIIPLSRGVYLLHRVGGRRSKTGVELTAIGLISAACVGIAAAYVEAHLLLAEDQNTSHYTMVILETALEETFVGLTFGSLLYFSFTTLIALGNTARAVRAAKHGHSIVNISAIARARILVMLVAIALVITEAEMFILDMHVVGLLVEAFVVLLCWALYLRMHRSVEHNLQAAIQADAMQLSKNSQSHAVQALVTVRRATYASTFLLPVLASASIALVACTIVGIETRNKHLLSSGVAVSLLFVHTTVVGMFVVFALLLSRLMLARAARQTLATSSAGSTTASLSDTTPPAVEAWDEGGAAAGGSAAVPLAFLTSGSPGLPAFSHGISTSATTDGSRPVKSSQMSTTSDRPITLLHHSGPPHDHRGESGSLRSVGTMLEPTLSNANMELAEVEEGDDDSL